MKRYTGRLVIVGIGLSLAVVIFNLVVAQSNAFATFDDAKQAITERRYADAQEILGKLAEKNNLAAINTYARLCLGRHFSNCTGSDAEAFLIEGAKLGSSASQFDLALLYRNGGYRLEKNPFKAQRWLKKAAKSNHPGAQYILGTIYLTGNGIRREPEKGWRLIKEAAKQGVMLANHDIAAVTFYGQSDRFGVRYFRSYNRNTVQSVKAAAVSDSEVREMALLAANSGYPPSQLLIGEMYSVGFGGATDHTSARQWMNKAASSGVAEVVERSRKVSSMASQVALKDTWNEIKEPLNKWLSSEKNQKTAIYFGATMLMIDAGRQIGLEHCLNDPIIAGTHTECRAANSTKNIELEDIYSISKILQGLVEGQ